MNRHQHAPPLVAGILIGLLSAQHLIALLAVTLAAGILLGRFWHTIGSLAGAAYRRLQRPYDRELEP